MNQPPLLVMGVDPGTAITGYGIVRVDDSVTAVAYGAIRTPADQPLPCRLQQIHRELGLVIDQYHPREAAVEELFFARNARTALAVGHARGVILFALAQAGLDVYEYTPLQVKQAITGYGRATKEQIQEMIRLLLSLGTIPKPDDAADALAVAVCHAHTLSVRLRMAEAVVAAGGAP
jgi:crossover junction endodeoxyribonuclease RuvC